MSTTSPSTSRYDQADDDVAPRTSGAASLLSGPLAPFRSATFRDLWLGSVLTWACQFLQLVAFPWVIYELTDSPTWLGIVSFARGIPMLLLSLPGGVLVDRLDRGRLLLVSQTIAGLVPAALAVMLWTDTATPALIAVAAFVAGTVYVVIIPARQALIPNAVPRQQVAAAIGLVTAGTNAGRVLGPTIGGLVMAGLGLAATFVAQALIFVVAILLSVRVPTSGPPRTSRSSSPIHDLLEGLAFVRRDRAVLALILVAAVTCLLPLPYTYLLPIFVRDILQAGPGGMGLILGSVGVGAVTGSLAMAVLAPRRQGPLLLASIAVFSLLLLGLALSRSLEVSLVLACMMGLAQSVFLAANNTLLIVATPDELRGRVMSVYITTWGFVSIGALPQGILAELVGAPAVAIGAAVLSLLTIGLIALRERRLWEI